MYYSLRVGWLRKSFIILAKQQGVWVALDSFAPYNIVDTFWRLVILAPGFGFIYWGKYLEGKNDYELW